MVKWDRRPNPCFVHDGVVYVQMDARGLAVIGQFDESDYWQWLAGTRLAAVPASGTFYVRLWREGRLTYAHRLIMNPPQGLVVDHRDHCGLNNRRGNLRVVTQEVNNWNKRGAMATSRSRSLGVHRSATQKKWVAQITCQGKVVSLGSFVVQHEAAGYYRTMTRLRDEGRFDEVRPFRGPHTNICEGCGWFWLDPSHRRVCDFCTHTGMLVGAKRYYREVGKYRQIERAKAKAH